MVLQQNDMFLSFFPIGETFTLRFDATQRHCIGWRDIATGERFVCPDSQTVDSKFEQCAACQKRTGFNPAFYHATSVSSQQEARNLEPHILYLAHFGSGIIKVGISHAKRGHGRLLEQGARLALILDTCSSAHIARQYEARIAALPGIAETIQQRKKSEAMKQPYDTTAAKKELTDTQATIESALQLTFENSQLHTYDSIYFPAGAPSLTYAHHTDDHLISGKGIGMLGSQLFCEHQDTPLYLPLKKYTGYTATLTYDETPQRIPAQQTSLF